VFSTMTEHIQVANHVVDVELGWTFLVEGARRSAGIVRWYDCAGTNEVTAAAAVNLESLGRLACLGVCLPADAAGSVVDMSPSAPWASVPVEARLADADPACSDGLFNAADALHRHFSAAVPRGSASVVSALLHLSRPGLFPVLDLPVRRLYNEPAQRAWGAHQGLATSQTSRSYWQVIRDDVLAAEGVIASWRVRLAASEAIEEKRVATLSDIRLWEIMARGLGSESPAHS